ncbi:Peptidase M24 [Trinorchestia longiramus]|nr:Peptidase M24 [Trinorchestia longiramus]
MSCSCMGMRSISQAWSTFPLIRSSVFGRASCKFRKVHSSALHLKSEQLKDIAGSPVVNLALRASAEAADATWRKDVPAAQPTHFTHPHALQPHEVTVGISASEYRERRARVMERLCRQEGRHHVLLLSAAPRRYMIDKIPYLYRQDTDMLWCSGCLESDCVLVVHTVGGGSPDAHRAVMFCPHHTALNELWDGPRTRPEHASHVWDVDEGLPREQLIKYLTGLEKSLKSPTLWYHHRDPPNPTTHRLLQSWLLEGRSAGLESPKQHLHALRVVKSPAELRLMRRACRLSAEAMRDTMAWTRAGMSEHQLFARVDYESRMKGACHLAYPPVVAGGNRANIIHYINNNQIIKDGEMVLMDAGSEYHGYSGDVSRTWPVNGRFTGAQRELYEAVLHVQSAVLALLRDARPSLDQLYREMCKQLANVLTELSIVPKHHSMDAKTKVAMALCPHHVSHYLGMDVHDTATVARSDIVLPNSVITVEPGIYIPEGSPHAPARYHGVGIRIEDDVLVTATGCEVLTDHCPRHPDDIEQLMTRSSSPHSLHSDVQG